MASLNLHLTLADDCYRRERLDPQPRDQFYLHLLDLVSALRLASPAVHGRLLDFGCGGAPYTSILPAAEYFRADQSMMDDFDYLIANDGTLPEVPNDSFDTVLSTQVLEHVPDPQKYLREAWRILKPGGTLILSTHGTFSDHPCPDDFWRWTQQGLEHLLNDTGFPEAKTSRLTCGARATWFLFDQSILQQRPKYPSTTLPLLSRIIRRIHLALRPLVNISINHLTLSDSSIQTETATGLALYLGLLAIAHKPGSAASGQDESAR